MNGELSIAFVTSKLGTDMFQEQESSSGCQSCEQYPVRTCENCSTELCRGNFDNPMDNEDSCREVFNHDEKPVPFKQFCRTCRKYGSSKNHPNYNLSESEVMLEFFTERVSTENKKLREVVKPFYQETLEYMSKEQSDIANCYQTAKEHIDVCEHLLHKQVTFAATRLKNALVEKEEKQMEHISQLRKRFKERLEELMKTIQINNNLLLEQDIARFSKFESSITSFYTPPDLTGFVKPIFKPSVMVHAASPHFLGELRYHEAGANATQCSPNNVRESQKLSESQS